VVGEPAGLRDASVEQMNVYVFSLPAGRVELLRSLDVRRRQGAPAERRPVPGRTK